jgi:hypothetical protein
MKIKEELMEKEQIQDEEAICHRMSEIAIKEICAGPGSGFHNEAMRKGVVLEEVIGGQASTQVLIYNASGHRMQLQHHGSYSGLWSDYNAPNCIEVGEWAICYHRNGAEVNTASHGYMYFELEGTSQELLVSWRTPWIGSNSAYCKLISGEGVDTVPASLMSLEQRSSNSPTVGNERTKQFITNYSMSPKSSSVLTVIVGHQDHHEEGKAVSEARMQ